MCCSVNQNRYQGAGGTLVTLCSQLSHTPTSIFRQEVLQGTIDISGGKRAEDEYSSPVVAMGGMQECGAVPVKADQGS